MKNKTPANEGPFKLDYTKPEEIGLTNQNTLRQLVGVLGMLLPILLCAFLFMVAGHWRPLPSISHYYFTRSNGVFTIIVSLLAIFLMVYKGKEKLDFYLSLIAGVFALCLLLFPTDNLSAMCCTADMKYAVTFLEDAKVRVAFHYVASGIFLVCLAFMAIFLFTKSNKEPNLRGKRKVARNRIYRTCGVIMILAILVVGAGGLHIIPEDFYDQYKLTFWMEVVALESFGFAWLVKGEMLLKD